MRRHSLRETVQGEKGTTILIRVIELLNLESIDRGETLKKIYEGYKEVKLDFEVKIQSGGSRQLLNF